MLRVTKFLVAFLCCALCTDRSFSATEVDSVLRISEPEDFYPLNLKAYLLRDASGIISLDSVRRSGSLFAPIPDEIYRLKQDKGLAYYWVRFTVENLNEASLNYLVCLQPGIDQVDQYVFYRDSLVQHSSVGTAQAAKTRHLFLSHELTMPITLHTGTTVVYLRLQSHSEYSKQRGNIILSISNENSFVNFFLKTRFYQGVALGMLILILVLHMFIYVFARERTYLIYMVNIFLTIIYLAFRKNFQLEFDILWPTYTVANYLIDPINFILELTAIWFAQEFLETKKTAPVYHKIMNGLKYAMGIGFVLSLFAVQLEFMNAFSLLIGFVASIVMLLAAIRSFQRGNNLAAYVFFGFVPLAIIIIIYVFPTANYLHYESNETDMHYFAEALRALIFSIGVAERFYQFKKAALRAGIEKEQLQFEQQRQIQQEKERISRDLHDNIGSHLAVLSLELASISNDVGENTKLAGARENTHYIIDQLRDTVWAIESNQVSIVSLESKISSLLLSYRKRLSHIDFNLEIPDTVRNVSLKPSQAINVYRIIQEAIQNSIRHSTCSKIDIQFEYLGAGGKLMLSIRDNGQGFDPNQPPTDAEHHHGLRNMGKRVSEINGTLEIISRGFTEIRVSFPI